MATEHCSEVFVHSSNVMEMAYQVIADEAIESNLAELCFNVHRALKLDYYSFCEYTVENGNFVPCEFSDEYSLFDDVNRSIVFDKATSKEDVLGTKEGYRSECPECHATFQAKNFSAHLATCMGINDCTRPSRKTAKRYNEQCNSDSDADCSDYSGSSKKSKKKKIAVRKKPPGKIKVKNELCVSSTSDSNLMATGQTERIHGSKVPFAIKMGKVGVEPKRQIKSSTSDLGTEEDIDVDTVDEGDISILWDGQERNK